ncbi:MAG: leucine-rich repeat protein [Ruminococcus sp.]|nr:leucine-rich repeat protein [Ruminococcus sp.]
MRNSERIISVMLVLVMVLSIFCIIPFSVSAAEIGIGTITATPDELYPKIKIGETITVDIDNAGDIIYLRFVPEKDMEIIFFGNSNYDTFGYIYDEEYVELASDDDSGEGLNFSISLAVEGGKVYYMAAKFINSDEIGSFDITLESSASSTQSEFEYRILDDGTIEIESYRGRESDILIPSSIDGYTVTGIGKYAFFGNDFERVIVANTVTYIERGAFYECFKLKEIVLGAKLTSIGVSAFMECESLEAIELPDSVQMIENSAFAYCHALKNITIPEGVIAIQEDTFFDCKSMESISLPKSLQVIDNEAVGYYMIEKGHDSLRKSDFIVRGYQGTVAETYAAEHNFKFVSLDGIADRAVGDCDGDGAITIMDATDVQYLISKGTAVEDEVLEYADVDRNSLLEIVDATYIQRSVAKIIIPYTVGNEKGRELEESIKSISYDASGEPIWESELSYEYMFDDKGNVMQSTHLQNGEMVASVKYTYNAVGDRIKESRYNQDGELLEEIDYNEAGLETSATNYLSSHVSKTEYDEYGNRTRHTVYIDGSVDHDGTYVNEYDENGNKVATTLYINDVPERKFVYEYDEANDMIKSYEYDLKEDRLVFRVKYTYDDSHRICDSVLYNAYGEILQSYDYWYDKEGRLFFEVNATNYYRTTVSIAYINKGCIMISKNFGPKGDLYNHEKRIITYY